jgi:hypothetical protein
MNKLLMLIKKMKATEADGWEYAKTHTCCPGDQAVKDIIKLIKKAALKKMQ